MVTKELEYAINKHYFNSSKLTTTGLTRGSVVSHEVDVAIVTKSDYILDDADLFHTTVICFKEKSDLGTNNYRQDYLGYVARELNDEELETLFDRKGIENVSSWEYKFIFILD